MSVGSTIKKEEVFLVKDLSIAKVGFFVLMLMCFAIGIVIGVTVMVIPLMAGAFGLLNADPLVIVAALAGSAATLLVVYTILLRKVINDQRDDAWQTGYGVGRKDGATNYVLPPVNPSAEEDTSEESATTDSA
ncbi:hypothetical protein COB80_01835 [Candidatus Kaiserbacteria bacterium]|nr:MAG: hypothetical protein COB80_01835 [Candidatus Kaiserbacteria bacterium]